MKLNAASRARLYALTCVACVIWLVQSLVEANDAGQMWNWSNIIFTLCLLVVVVYTGVSAFRGWNAKEPTTENTRTHQKEGEQ